MNQKVARLSRNYKAMHHLARVQLTELEEMETRQTAKLETLQSTLAYVEDTLRQRTFEIDHRVMPILDTIQPPVAHVAYNKNAHYMKSSQLPQHSLLQQSQQPRRYSVSSFIQPVFTNALQEVPHMDQSDFTLMMRENPCHKRVRLTDAVPKGSPDVTYAHNPTFRELARIYPRRESVNLQDMQIPACFLNDQSSASSLNRAKSTLSNDREQKSNINPFSRVEQNQFVQLDNEVDFERQLSQQLF